VTENIRSNVYKQGTKILRSIAEHYEAGGIESPEANHMLMQLFALVIEGKVRGDVSEDTGYVKWSLTKEASEDIDRIYREREEKMIVEGTIVKGPWL